MSTWNEEQYQLLLDLKNDLKNEGKINGQVNTNTKDIISSKKEHQYTNEDSINDDISEDRIGNSIWLMNEKIKNDNK